MSRAIEFMRRALKEAERGLGRTRPNPVVGCVVARGNRIISVGHHERAGLPHAEAVALRRAGDAARGADVYVTLEPCNHFGRTPPCTDALIEAGVKRVYIGMRDPNPIVDGRGIRRLKAAGVEVHVGVLQAECERVNEAFTHFLRHRRPFVVSKVAQSLDGRVSTRLLDSKWITGEKARKEGHRLRNVCDAIVVGSETARIDGPSLTCRIRYGRDPIRIVLDSRARLSPTAQVVAAAQTSKAPTWIVVTDAAKASRCAALENAGATVIRCAADAAGRVELNAFLAMLGSRDILSLLVEGGPTLTGAFFDARLVDRMHVFTAPLIIGGEQAKGSVLGLGSARLPDSARLRDCRVEQLGPDWHVQGYPVWEDG